MLETWILNEICIDIMNRFAIFDNLIWEFSYFDGILRISDCDVIIILVYVRVQTAGGIQIIAIKVIIIIGSSVCIIVLPTGCLGVHNSGCICLELIWIVELNLLNYFTDF